MLINDPQELLQLLENHRAKSLGELPSSTPATIQRALSQYQYRLPSGHKTVHSTVIEEPFSVLIPITKDGNYVCIMRPNFSLDFTAMVTFPYCFSDNREDIPGSLLHNTGYVGKDIKFCCNQSCEVNGFQQTFRIFKITDCVRKEPPDPNLKLQLRQTCRKVIKVAPHVLTDIIRKPDIVPGRNIPIDPFTGLATLCI